MEHVAFFDLEVSTQPKARIQSIGAWFRGQTWHTSSVHEFEQFQLDAKYLCGHNILAHDLPYIKKAGVSEDFLRKQFIDTLYLSPLFFPSRPYHKLVKDYQLLSDHFNNPVEDSKITADLLEECVGAYHNLPKVLKQITYRLLVDERPFSAFFDLLEETILEQENDSLERLIHSYFKNRICSNPSLHVLIDEQPIPLAYALTLIDAPDQGSITPPS